MFTLTAAHVLDVLYKSYMKLYGKNKTRLFNELIAVSQTLMLLTCDCHDSGEVMAATRKFHSEAKTFILLYQQYFALFKISGGGLK